jgi:hypothetical protein
LCQQIPHAENLCWWIRISKLSYLYTILSFILFCSWFFSQVSSLSISFIHFEHDIYLFIYYWHQHVLCGNIFVFFFCNNPDESGCCFILEVQHSVCLPCTSWAKRYFVYSLPLTLTFWYCLWLGSTAHYALYMSFIDVLVWDKFIRTLPLVVYLTTYICAICGNYIHYLRLQRALTWGWCFILAQL